LSSKYICLRDFLLDLGSGVVTAEYINRYSTGRDVTIGNVLPHILEEDRLHGTTPD